MERFETVWRVMVSGFAVWRLSRILFDEKRGEVSSESVSVAAEDSTARFWIGRAADVLCWISVWMSSQTAMWVAFGFAGVLASWLSVAGLSGLFFRPTESSLCVTDGDGTRAHHG